MKLFLLSFFLFAVGAVNAATYYFSFVSGDDSRTATQAQNSSTPWKTIDKLNSYMSTMAPGDSVLFKRGETWVVTPSSITHHLGGTTTVGINMNEHGIVFDYYGTGNKPIISGMKTITSWTNVGGGIYESDVIGSNNSLNMVTINGIVYAMGRYPNSNTTNKGWLTVDSDVDNVSITDAALPSSPDWDGGRLVIKTKLWYIDTTKIVSHSGTTITFSKTLNPVVGYGYFIENHEATLDQFGEWYYNTTTKKMKMYFGAATPSNYTVKATAVDILFYNYNKDDVEIHNIVLDGSNTEGVYLYSADRFSLTNSTIQYCGNSGGTGSNSNYNKYENNTIQYCHNMGLDLRGGTTDGRIIRSNYIKSCGMFEGHGGVGDHTRMGLNVTAGKNHIIELNHIDSTGYVGMKVRGDSTVVQKNLVENFLRICADGAGIYTGDTNWDDPGVVRSGFIIQDNIVRHGEGPIEGSTATVKTSNGIYLDDGSSNIIVRRNTCYDVGKAAMYFHNTFNIEAYENTLYDAEQAVFQIVNDNPPPTFPWVKGIKFYDNIIVSSNASWEMANFYTKATEADNTNNIRAWSTAANWNNNVFANPFTTGNNINLITEVYEGVNEVRTYKTLATWKTYSGYDLNSTGAPKALTSVDSLRIEANPTSSPVTISFPGKKYLDPKGVTISNGVTLQPFTSVILFADGGTGSNVAPVADAGSNIISSNGLVTLQGSGSDADGTISSYLWTLSGGTGAIIADPTSATTTVSGLTTGTYQFTLTVTDNAGGTDTDIVQVIVAVPEGIALPIKTGSKIVFKKNY